MQIVRFSVGSRSGALGVLHGTADVLDLATVAACPALDSRIQQRDVFTRDGNDLIQWLDVDDALATIGLLREHALQHVAGDCPHTLTPDVRLDQAECTFAPLILNARKLLGVGVNFPSHLAEARAAGQNFDDPTEPLMFSKVPTALTGNNTEVTFPRQGTDLDYEVELGVVMGRRCRELTADTVRDAIAGYVVVNDASLRDVLGKPGGVFEGKNYDGFLPMSSVLVTADEVPDTASLVLESFVNGTRRQHEEMGNAVFSPNEIIIHVSERMTLEPGDVIFCGTPAGVGLFAPDPREALLKRGDTVEVRIDRIGSATNRIV